MGFGSPNGMNEVSSQTRDGVSWSIWKLVRKVAGAAAEGASATAPIATIAEIARNLMAPPPWRVHRGASFSKRERARQPPASTSAGHRRRAVAGTAEGAFR